MSEDLNIFINAALLIFVIVPSYVIYIGYAMTAHSRASNESFWGGIDIIGGWWVIFPYGEYGLEKNEENKKLVRSSRLCFLFFYLGVACAILINYG